MRISDLFFSAFLTHGDYNVIVVDHASIAKLEYPKAASFSKAVGAYVAKMIDFLASKGSSLNDMTLVGHSLGAHVIGLAGYQASNKVGHVVGQFENIFHPLAAFEFLCITNRARNSR